MAVTDHELENLIRVMGRRIGDVSIASPVRDQLIIDNCLTEVEGHYIATPKGQRLASHLCIRRMNLTPAE